MESHPGTTKRICIVSPEYPPGQWGGLARTVQKVSLHAADMGLDVHVAHFTVAQSPVVLLDENRESELIDRVTVHHLLVGREHVRDSDRELWDCPHTLTLMMMYQSLEMLHQEFRFDLFHSFFLYPTGYVTALLARRVGVSSVVTLVGNDIKKYLFSPEKVAVCRIGLESSDRVAALSRELMEMAHALTPVEHKARIIYNSVTVPPEAWNKARSRGEPFKIGCGGIFKYAKGLPYLFKAISRIRLKHPVVLELLGALRQGERPVYEEMLRRTGIQDILVFRDALPHDRVGRWLRSLDAFALPSVSEGCPNILMEAMACGLPCVATRVGAVEDLVEDRVSGLLVPLGDSEALAKAVAEIIEDEDLARELGKNARRRMRQFHSARERAGWEAVYREMIAF
ncbi:MAG: glycosyltransferase family 4 protein [Deltaproteobacteria bacterium]|nr:glycosyltransferase family 4 protein [Deltaproteobacteria bacterium]